MTPPVLIIPGWNGSGPRHWQSLWQNAHPEYQRVEQDDWDHPARAAWVGRLDEYVARSPQPPVLVAHSLGCLLVAHWTAQHRRPVHSALLVAPPDLEASALTADSDFLPLPTEPLPFPSVLIGSANDDWCELNRAQRMAQMWGARFANAGPCGHINADAGFGPWEMGEKLLAELIVLSA